MGKPTIRYVRRQRRRRGIRKGVFGTPQRPRMSVYRSLKHIYAQIIDDLSGRTLVSSSSIGQKMGYGGNAEAARQIGTALAQAARSQGIEQVAFDRGGFKYHGRVKALADAAREAGLKF